MDVEARLDLQFIDQVFEGQVVTVRFMAFNAKTTPEVEGRISFVSADTTQDPATGLQYYRFGINLPEENLAPLHGQKLVPGMPVEVHAKTDDRTPLSYLTKPLTDQIKRAWRE
jgi:HlyD family secretion protein